MTSNPMLDQIIDRIEDTIASMTEPAEQEHRTELGQILQQLKAFKGHEQEWDLDQIGALIGRAHEILVQVLQVIERECRH